MTWESRPEPGLNVVIPRGHETHLQNFFIILCKRVDVFPDGRVEAEIMHGLPHGIQELRWSSSYISQHLFLSIPGV
jgi:hypothetical protein